MFISNTKMLAYLSMLASTFTNAGLVAIGYPFMLFGYALLEEKRPSPAFWNVVLTYSLTILLCKYIINLDIVREF